MIVRSARVAPSQHADLEPEWCGPPAAALRCPYLRVASESAHPSANGNRSLTRWSSSAALQRAAEQSADRRDHQGLYLPAARRARSGAYSIIMAGRYQTKPSLPFSPGLETAGVIAVCGREASGFKPGDRVMAILQYGGLAEFAATPAKAFFLPAMLQHAAPELFRRHFVTGEVS